MFFTTAKAAIADKSASRLSAGKRCLASSNKMNEQADEGGNDDDDQGARRALYHDTHDATSRVYRTGSFPRFRDIAEC